MTSLIDAVLLSNTLPSSIVLCGIRTCPNDISLGNASGLDERTVTRVWILILNLAPSHSSIIHHILTSSSPWWRRALPDPGCDWCRYSALAV
eukprot:scaffold417992_cov67-Attheya_sp.AAC.1